MPDRKPSLPYTVLIVEDERAIAENLLLVLEREGFVTDIAWDAQAALARLEREPCDLVLLDIGLPGMDGHEMLRRMRQELRLSTPVLMLTARAALEDKGAAFSTGADDYLSKPFALEEVVMRAHALIRRSKQLSDATFALDHGPLHYRVADKTLFIGGHQVKLSRKNLMILELLMRHAGRIVTRERFEAHLWQSEPPSADALRAQIHLLRKALAAHGHDGIETIHGIGWRLTDPQQAGRV